VHDSLQKIVDAGHSPGVWTSFTSGDWDYRFSSTLVAEIKLLVRRVARLCTHRLQGIHIALLVAAFALFVAALRVETASTSPLRSSR
jgi:hypothetical protein